jgi:hypothetical protein
LTSDLIGKLDPFLIIEYGKTQHFKTHTIKHSVNPVWNEEFFLELDESVDEIVFKLFDFHLLKKADEIDSFKVKLSGLKLSKNDLIVNLKKGAIHLIVDLTQLQKPQIIQQPIMMVPQPMIIQQPMIPKVSQIVIPPNAPPELLRIIQF